MQRPFKLGTKVRLKEKREGEVVGYTNPKDKSHPVTVVVRMNNGDICQFYPESFLEEIKPESE
jgi:hypothetical protein